MWLICNNAILTKDILIKRKWVGDERCSFCCEPESISHLLFGCSMAKYVWSMVAWVLGANCRPTSLEQFWVWIRQILPAGKQFYMPGLAAICWGLWIARNSVCFEKKIIRSPTEIICSTCSFLSFWADLQKQEDQDKLKEGVEVLKHAALSFHPQDDGDLTGTKLIQHT